jgi:hypothetical protein
MWFIIGVLGAAVILTVWHVVLLVGSNIDLTNKARATSEVIGVLSTVIQTRLDREVELVGILNSVESRLKKLELQASLTNSFYRTEAGSD